MDPILIKLAPIALEILAQDYRALEAKYRRALERRADAEWRCEQALNRLESDVCLGG